MTTACVLAALGLLIGFVVGHAWPQADYAEPAPEPAKTKIDLLA